ncbi:FkbM family methyltransferase [Methylobacterium sp. Leaf361]|uniref:FkbM family methyltransferase n=1 Tax=Methylobacterium sp. Leaf361 TaxID=1736352 RepID=UPI000A9B9FD7|nr:FkbM family methyltransferase [Methylobacterium sp. Leaf361]
MVENLSSSNTGIVKVGQFEIEAPHGHIYHSENLPDTYDYVPWNVIAATINEANIDNVHLIDVGANVGDSLAHFRRFSDAPVTCVEASKHFFGFLERNARQFGNVNLINKLVAPKNLFGKLHFSSGDQTGSTDIAAHPNLAWSGEHIALEQLLNDSKMNYIFKTDTDGFDLQIVRACLDASIENSSNVPIIFFEGPNADLLQSGDLENWFRLFTSLQVAGYGLLFLTNSGFPYCYAGRDKSAARSALQSLSLGYKRGRAVCHYFDIIAIADDLHSVTARLQQTWGDEIFARV